MQPDIDEQPVWRSEVDTVSHTTTLKWSVLNATSHYAATDTLTLVVIVVTLCVACNAGSNGYVAWPFRQSAMSEQHARHT